MSNIVPKSADLLLVEDSDTDAELTERALRKGKLVNMLHRVRDGVEAMQFLRKEGEYSNAPRPDMILLDLNMPRMDGKSVLRELSSDESLKLIPVVVLTTSNHDADILESYGLNSNAYLVKPVDVTEFFLLIQKTHEFWVHLVKLPPF